MLEAGWNPFTKEAETPQQQEVKTIKQVIDDCVAMKCATLKKFSHKVYKHVSKYFLIWLEKKCISYLFSGSFTRTMAIEYMDMLAMKGYNQKTYNNHLLTLCTIFNWMIERDIITNNPFSKLPKMKEKQSEHSSFTAPERDRLKTALIDNNKRLYYACQFVYYCMLRRPELASIRVGDIDFENMTIKISGSNAKNGRSEMVTIPKSFEPIIYEMGLHSAPKSHYIFGSKMETFVSFFKQS